jgi:GT2 family glycosyltransferase
MNNADKPHPVIAAVIASTGRTQVLRETVENVLQQSWRPNRVVIAVIKPGDCDIAPYEFDNVRVILARKGLSAQLNDAVSLLGDEVEYVCFFDDDVVLVDDYIEKMVGFMQRRADIVALSGHAFRDGGLSGDEARHLVKTPPAVRELEFKNSGKHWVLYGCNMVIRRHVFLKEKFDERFVLYAWMFEIEMTYRLLAYGKVGRYAGGQLIHLKVQSGRISGVKFGYTQLVNRWYLALRPSLKGRRFYILCWAAYWIMRSTVENFIFQITRKNDPYIDYAGRFRGNLRAWYDLFQGKVCPERIEGIK